MLGLSSISITLRFYRQGCKDFCHFYLFAVKQAGFFCLCPYVSDSERQHIGVALRDVVCLYLLDGVEGENGGLVCLRDVLTVKSV